MTNKQTKKNDKEKQKQNDKRTIYKIRTNVQLSECGDKSTWDTPRDEPCDEPNVR